MEKRTPRRPLPNKFLEKTSQHRYHTLGNDSPFRLLPVVSTPPSSILTIKNPFESQLTERLHRSVFSPSVFNVQSTKTEDKFRWTIEEISTLKPADIDEKTVDLFEMTDHDVESEISAQAKIESYFNEKLIVPSPFNVVNSNPPLITDSGEKKFKQLVEGEAQTVLTLPPTLPDHLEAVLKPFFSYTADQQQDKESRSSLYRRLFELNDSDSPNNSALTSPAPSCVLSPIELSPYDEATTASRNFGSPHDPNGMPDCNLSPIATNSPTTFSRVASASRLNFSPRMSVDTSLNLVPDTLDQLPSNNQSLAFESMHSPVPELLSNSTINWDLEYKHISLASSSGDEMDVSNSNTPKSKIFISQRKKLSDSFLRVDESDEDKENVFNMNNFRFRNTKVSFLSRDGDSTIDVGYHTGSRLMISEESCNSPHLYASTPTKDKK
ncbi:hypothetical protein PPYR_12068 [Photinus pyralis]|uniref:Protein aurora borealis n=1 Tax=Photinus pyralis TaxID=7054 RepID=A0A1Y1KJP6_PHOPY|nr:protein aurora borealis isoform X1 [Photinus pyralis]KAB0795229.1 hypothetical protein PPYR_12068 [Photinus pyralis]